MKIYLAIPLVWLPAVCTGWAGSSAPLCLTASCSLSAVPQLLLSAQPSPGCLVRIHLLCHMNVSVHKTECPISLIASSCKPCSNGYLLWPWDWLIFSERFFPYGPALSEGFLKRAAAQNCRVRSVKFHEQFCRTWLWWCPALVHWTAHFIEMDWDWSFIQLPGDSRSQKPITLSVEWMASLSYKSQVKRSNYNGKRLCEISLG